MHSYTGLLAFDGKVERVFQLRRGREPSLHILSALERIAVSGCKSKGTALSSALEAAGKLLRQRALVIILSDFKVENFEKELGVLARRHDVAAIRITAPYDEALPSAGILRFTDPETGLERLLPTNSHQFRQDRIRRIAEDTQRWENACIRCGAYPLVLPHDGNTVKLLNQFFLTGKYGAQPFSRYRTQTDTAL